MASVIRYAELRGFLVYHTFDSRKSPPGYPDLCLCRASRLIYAELKVGAGRLSADQERWLAALRAVPRVEVYCWYPADWDAIEGVLR
jgi:hypothetical protein